MPNIAHLLILIPLSVLPFSFLFSNIFVKKNKIIMHTSRALIFVLIIGGLIFSSIKYYKTNNSTNYDAVHSTVAYINENTGNDEKILVNGNSNIIYLLSNRMPANKFSYTQPIFKVNEEFKQEYIKGIIENRPRCIIQSCYAEDILGNFNSNASLDYSLASTIDCYDIYLLKDN